MAENLETNLLKRVNLLEQKLDRLDKAQDIVFPRFATYHFQKGRKCFAILTSEIRKIKKLNSRNEPYEVTVADLLAFDPGLSGGVIQVTNSELFVSLIDPETGEAYPEDEQPIVEKWEPVLDIHAKIAEAEEATKVKKVKLNFAAKKVEDDDASDAS